MHGDWMHHEIMLRPSGSREEASVLSGLCENQLQEDKK